MSIQPVTGDPIRKCFPGPHCIGKTFYPQQMIRNIHIKDHGIIAIRNKLYQSQCT